MFDADGTYPARADGGDIRFSSDQAGTIELPLEVYYFLRDNNPANGKAEIHVKVPAVSSSVNTVIYVWYNNPSATGYARNAAYGSDNVWDSHFKFVAHLGASVDDSTSNAVSGTNYGTTDDSVTYIGVSSRKFVRSSSQYIDYLDTVKISGDVDITTEFIGRISSSPALTWAFLGKDASSYYMEILASDIVQFGIYIGSDWELIVSDAALSINTWAYFAATRTASDNTSRMLKDGVAQASTDTSSTIAVSTDHFMIGAEWEGTPDRYLDGYVEEVRVSDSVRANAWIQATYNSLQSAGTFASAGTPESGGGARIFDFSPFFM
jgi:hypothetical protein